MTHFFWLPFHEVGISRWQRQFLFRLPSDSIVHYPARKCRISNWAKLFLLGDNI